MAALFALIALLTLLVVGCSFAAHYKDSGRTADIEVCKTQDCK